MRSRAQALSRELLANARSDAEARYDHFWRMALATRDDTRRDKLFQMAYRARAEWQASQ